MSDMSMAGGRTSSPSRREPPRASVPLSAWALCGMFVAIIAHVAWHYPALPHRMASHFDAAGAPDGWSGRQTYLAIILAIAGLLALVFLGLGTLLRRIPLSLINLPNREHWLAPERRDQSLASITAMLRWFGVATLALVLLMNQLVFAANLSPHPNLGNTPWVMIGGYLVFVIAWSALLLRRFARPTPHL